MSGSRSISHEQNACIKQFTFHDARIKSMPGLISRSIYCKLDSSDIIVIYVLLKRGKIMARDPIGYHIMV
jgi:hypothetical protein